MDVAEVLKNGRLTISVRSNAKKTEILDWKDEVVKVAVAAPPEDNKANLEIVKFFTKLVGQRVRIVSGSTSKKKVLSL